MSKLFQTCVTHIYLYMMEILITCANGQLLEGQSDQDYQLANW